MSGSRKHYSSNRKVEILCEHLETGISISELSRRYNIHPNMIHNWQSTKHNQKDIKHHTIQSRNNHRASSWYNLGYHTKEG